MLSQAGTDCALGLGISSEDEKEQEVQLGETWRPRRAPLACCDEILSCVQRGQWQLLALGWGRGASGPTVGESSPDLLTPIEVPRNQEQPLLE